MIVTTTVIAIAAVAYSYSEAQKAKKAAAAAADAAKGFEVTVEGQMISLPVIYGRSIIGGASVYFGVKSSYTHNTTASGGITFQSNMTASRSGNANEFLFTQQALCHSGINNILDWRLDDQNSDTSELKYGQRMHLYKDGSLADPMLTSNFSERNTALFTNTAYASMVFRLNRDDPQYNGPPSVQFYIEGKKIRSIIKSGSIYTLNSTYSYSNNPAYCLLDYLLSTTYGRGLSVSEIDLETFYNAAQICNRTVRSVSVATVNIFKKQGVTIRSLPLFEANITLDTTKPVRENVIELLKLMEDADLVWTDGKYKLQLQYPTSEGAIVTVGSTITDDNIVNKKIDIVYPSASERMNFCTITYKDEAEDYKENSVNWPKKGSTVYNTYLAEDNYIPLESSFSEVGIIDYYHALAKAEATVRKSRNAVKYNFQLNLKNMFYEPGDIIRVDSVVANINNELMKINEVSIDENSIANITATKYEVTNLAWNVSDNQIVASRNNYSFLLKPPINIVFTPNLGILGGLGYLSWTVVSDDTTLEPSSYLVEYYDSVDFKYKTLGTTTSNFLELYSIVKGTYSVTVRSVSLLGTMSVRSEPKLITIIDGTEIAPTFNVSDTLVSTGSSIKTKLTVEITNPVISDFIESFEVDISSDVQHGFDIALPWTTIGRSSNNIFEYVGVEDSRNYKIRARVFNKIGRSSAYTLRTSYQVIGKIALPQNVTNLNINTTDVNQLGLTLIWDKNNELDFLKYVVKKGISWNSAQLVATVTDNKLFIERPSAENTKYLVKALDSLNQESEIAAEYEVSFSGPSKVSTIESKIIGENYNITWSESISLLALDYYIVSIDDGFGVFTELAKLKSTSFTSKISWNGIRTLKVEPVDIGNNVGIANTKAININPADAVTALTVQVIDNNVLLSWEPSVTLLPITGYEISKGATYETSTLIGTIQSDFFAVFETAGGSYRYWITPIDSAGQKGYSNSVLADVTNPPNFELKAQYSSVFDSTNTSNAITSSEGILFNFDSSRTWNSYFTDNAYSDLNEASENMYFIQPGLTTGYYEEIVDYGTVIDNAKIELTIDKLQVLGASTVTVFLSTSLDNVTYTTPIEALEQYSSNFQYLKMRIEVSSSSDSILQIKALDTKLSIKLKEISGQEDISSSGTFISVTGQLLDIKTISVTPMSTTPVVVTYYYVDEPNPSGFTIYCFNQSGTPVACRVSWTVTGY